MLYGICKFAPPAIFVADVAFPDKAPLNVVVAKVPVFGTKLILVELVVAGLLPLVATDKTG